MSTTASAIDPVTARWAGALFNLAQRQGALDEVRLDVERLGAEFANPKVRGYLLSSQSTAAERLATLGGLIADFNGLTRNFVLLVFDRRREEVLAGLAEAFRRRMLTESGVQEGVVETPRALGSTELRTLEASLGSELGAEVRLTQRINEDLVAGVRIFVGTRMIDRSVQGRLETLRRRLTGAHA